MRDEQICGERKKEKQNKGDDGADYLSEIQVWHDKKIEHDTKEEKSSSNVNNRKKLTKPFPKIWTIADMSWNRKNDVDFWILHADY